MIKIRIFQNGIGQMSLVHRGNEDKIPVLILKSNDKIQLNSNKFNKNVRKWFEILENNQINLLKKNDQF